MKEALNVAALDPTSFGVGVFAGAVAAVALDWLLAARGWGEADPMGYFGVVVAGVAPLLGWLGFVVVSLLT